MKNDEILHKWINNTISEAELKQFKLRSEYDSLVELYKRTENLAPPKLNKELVLANILAQPKVSSKKETAKIVRIPNFLKMAAVAATAAVLLGIFFFWPSNQMINYEIGLNQKIEGNFPDASTFILNAGSSLSYDKDVWSKKRMILLDGEAFFEVEKGNPFTVKTKNGSVEVLGTQFNVKSRANILEVSCQEGTVMVSSSKSTVKKKLSAKQAVRFIGKAIPQTWVDESDNAKAWTIGITKLKDVSLASVIEELKLHYDLSFETDSIELTERLSCNFPHNNIDLALSSCFDPLKIKYEKIGDRIIKITK